MIIYSLLCCAEISNVVVSINGLELSTQAKTHLRVNISIYSKSYRAETYRSTKPGWKPQCNCPIRWVGSSVFFFDKSSTTDYFKYNWGDTG